MSSESRPYTATRLTAMATTATLLVLFFQLSIPLVAGVLKLRVHECDSVNGNYTDTSPYKNNLHKLLSETPNITNNYGFYNLSAGNSPDVANLISLCRGDVDVTTCHTCQLYVIKQLQNVCPNQKTAIAWSDDCMVRYSNHSIFGVLEQTPYFDMYNPMFASNVAQFNQVLWQLLETLPFRASSGDSRLKFATSQADVNSTVTIYAAAQCTPDLTQKDCLKCLNDTVREIDLRSLGRRGARFFFPSCNVRYEQYKFYLSSAADFQPPFPISPSGNGSGNRKTVTILAACTGSLSMMLVAAILFIILRKRMMAWNLPTNKHNDGQDISKIDSLQFDLSMIIAATGNFSETNKLGPGGFGDVYKGILSDGQEIAVRRLERESSQDKAEFKNELALIAKLYHKNLVKFLGFCLQNEERLLIYEFAPNGSLDQFLFDASRRAQLDWKTRYKIIIGIARGILYLHDDSRLRVVHRDIRASNILLDAEMCPKITGFGSAKLFDADQTHAEASRIVGRDAYMAPEYELYGYFSTKSDVYSYGVLLLEIVSGRKCSSGQNEGTSESLIKMVWGKWNEGLPLEAVDPTILEGSEADILRCIHIGLLCVQDKLVDRPTMSSVVLLMSSESLELPLPSLPGFAVSTSASLGSSISRPAKELE